MFAIALLTFNCGKEMADSLNPTPEWTLKNENPPEIQERLPRIRFRYHYEFIIEGCNGGECGGCPGFCIIFGGKLGPAPTSGEKEAGIGRAMILVGDAVVTIIPIDLPMDPGTGRALLSENLVFDAELSEWLGFTKVTLLKGDYPIDYTQSDPFGRVVVPADLVK